MNRIPRPGEFYRHFKNRLYQVIAVAEHSETGERMVVYQALYGDFKTFVRPLEMFVSEVDHDRYPQVDQRYRFELTAPDQWSDAQREGADWEEGAEGMPDPLLLRFLEAKDCREKLEVLDRIRERAEQEDLDSIYVALDMEPVAGSVESQLLAVDRHLRTQLRFDGTRLR